MMPHRIVKARGHDYCTVCSRAIRRVPRRPSGQVWAHYARLYWTGTEYVLR